MTRHLLFPVLINASDKLSRIASRGNQPTKFFNNLLNNFIQVVKTNEDFLGDISKRSATLSFNSPKRTKTLIGRFEALSLSFKISFSVLSALISSAKSEYDERDMFSSFIQYVWSSDAKGVADQ